MHVFILSYSNAEQSCLTSVPYVVLPEDLRQFSPCCSLACYDCSLHESMHESFLFQFYYAARRDVILDTLHFQGIEYFAIRTKLESKTLNLARCI